MHGWVRRVGTWLGALTLGLVLGACRAHPAPEDASSSAKGGERPASILCPTEDAEGAPLDLAAAFGVERALSARVERMLRVARELETSATELRDETERVCVELARGLSSDVVPADRAPCEVAFERFLALKGALTRGGASLSVSVQSVSCSLDLGALQACAGECLTGQAGIVSRVECAATEGGCGLDFSLPNASSACATQCAVRSLGLARCSAHVDVQLEGGAADLVAAVTALKTQVPRLVVLGGELSVRALEALASVRGLVDELAGAIDEVSEVGRNANASFVGGAVLAGCVGPRLADALRAGIELETSLTAAARLQHALLE
ncbi:MAG: hypothetical protein GX607_03800 [Myxococcales bacterium]|jgi:hypothetical protein|nr:hypothetical protein [Myxococcales bacterium]